MVRQVHNGRAYLLTSARAVSHFRLDRSAGRLGYRRLGHRRGVRYVRAAELCRRPWYDVRENPAWMAPSDLVLLWWASCTMASSRRGHPRKGVVVRFADVRDSRAAQQARRKSCAEDECRRESSVEAFGEAWEREGGFSTWRRASGIYTACKPKSGIDAHR
jgi:hypothetical protein